MMLEERLNNWVDSYNRNGYLNGTLLIASNGNILLNKGFGMANWEHSVSNVPTTKFRIGSLTKAFTAMAIFQLHEKKKLNINDAVEKYLPGYPNGHQITIYHCLTNSSGIPNYTNSPDFWTQKMRLSSTLDQLIDSFKDQELEFEPGSKFGYSNSGYALLTVIIEKVSDMSYADYIQQHICHPLGMYHTGCDDGLKIVPGLASGYSFWEEPIHSAYADMSFPLGSYGLYSTTEDLFIWDKELKSSTIINKELIEKMFTPNLGSYACGWVVSEVVGKKCVHHFGDISGFSSDFLRFVDNHVTIIFLSNMNVTPVMHLSREIAKIVFDKNVSLPAPTVPISFTKKESIVGKYVIEKEDKVLTLSIKNEELYLTVPKMYGAVYKFKLVPVSHDSCKTVFLTEMIYEQLIFYYSLSGQIENVQYVDCFEKKHMLHKLEV
ncbi:serine hydrolase domain-containing protein [Lysinibacillus sp. NPDC097231]|uniref:serine hydrolase domain-containing protein n=1 Tax=Lysinibacillus sp. NPDC097231 TaxID=3364142 RepID=UPI00381BABEB